MLDYQKRDIDGLTYEVYQLGSLQARKTLLRLTRSLGPVLKAGLANVKGGPTVAEVQRQLTLSVVGDVVASLSQNLTEEDLEYFVDVFGKASFVYIEGKRLQLSKDFVEGHFVGGKLLTLFKWLAFAVEWNYADFLAALPKKKKPDLEEKEPSESISQNP